MTSKHYRNRRLGEYLKELNMTEGRSTGIPTIQNVLENNGSPRATIVTDDDRTFFRITIPCHESAGNIIADIAHKDDSLRASRRGVLKSGPMTGPMDAIVPYRMEHCVSLEATNDKPVNQFWRDKLTYVLIDSVKADDGILIHLLGSVIVKTK